MNYTTRDLANLLRNNPDLILVTDGSYTTIEPVTRPLGRLSEHDLHTAVVTECDRRSVHDPRYKRIFHPASGEYRTKATAGKLKAMGVRKGLLDLYLIYPNWQGKAGWACELKVGKNRLTPEQEAEMKYLRSVGWAVECIWDDAQAVLDSLERFLGEP